MITLKKAKVNEAENILHFYQNVINTLENSEFKPKWNEYYPNLDYIKKSIEKNELYVYTHDDNIVSCVIINNQFNEEYENIIWNINAKPDEITIIHTFAVDSDSTGNGIGKEIFNQIKNNAIQNNQKTIRIDIIDGNVGAQKFFEKLGFEYIDTVETFHKAVGLEKFHFYELVLKK